MLCVLQGRRADGGRHPGRPGRDDVRCGTDDERAGKGRQSPRAGNQWEDTFVGDAAGSQLVGDHRGPRAFRIRLGTGHAGEDTPHAERRSAPGQDGDGATDGAAVGAADGVAGEAEGGVDAADDPLAAAEADGAAELDAAGVAIGAGDGLGFWFRKPP